MLKRLTGALAALVALTATPGLAQTYDAPAPTRTGWTTGNGLVAVFEMTGNATVNTIGIYTATSTSHRRKFLIYNQTDSRFEFVSTDVVRPASPIRSLDTFDLPSPVQLESGKRYMIGTIADNPSGYGTTPEASSPNIVPPFVAVPEYYQVSNFASPDTPNFGLTGRLEVSINPTSAPPTPAAVPTLTEGTMILLGLGLAGGAALVLHRRHLSA